MNAFEYAQKLSDATVDNEWGRVHGRERKNFSIRLSRYDEDHELLEEIIPKSLGRMAQEFIGMEPKVVWAGFHLHPPYPVDGYNELIVTLNCAPTEKHRVYYTITIGPDEVVLETWRQWLKRSWMNKRRKGIAGFIRYLEKKQGWK